MATKSAMRAQKSVTARAPARTEIGRDATSCGLVTSKKKITMATYPGSGNTTAPEGTDSEHHCLPAVGIELLPFGVSLKSNDSHPCWRIDT